ncbi:DUF6734 family protein [uncultured Kordia sp.]|uniref:DUF6734 family protein n=1 Tax=uncultured Kordia sp. TaxID=507699 RepID=UPI002605BA6D|nr:DUF6734 family protein [uncultured Kordia sp.]
MKIVQSFWSKPMRTQSNDIEGRFSGGWLDKKYLYMSWALSCLQFRKYFDNVELVTDAYGKKILIDVLKLPYTKVTVALDELDKYPQDLWALGKIYAYSIQKEPFIHADGDVFIWEDIHNKVKNAPLYVQSLEVNMPVYHTHFNEIVNAFEYIPDVLKNITPNKDILTAINAGLFGGHNLDFIQEYTKEAFKFVDDNLENMDTITKGPFNMIYEQLLFFYMAKHKQIEITSYFDSPNNFDLVQFSGIPGKIKYIHPIGVFKKSLEVNENIANKLLLEHPETYFHIDGLIKNLAL